MTHAFRALPVNRHEHNEANNRHGADGTPRAKGLQFEELRPLEAQGECERRVHEGHLSERKTAPIMVSRGAADESYEAQGGIPNGTDERDVDAEEIAPRAVLYDLASATSTAGQGTGSSGLPEVEIQGDECVDEGNERDALAPREPEDTAAHGGVSGDLHCIKI